jgi:arylsulfatase A-like enzyme
VSALDLFPTFCAAVGVDEPSGVGGQDLLPLLRGEPQGGRDAVHTVFHETAMKGRFVMRCRQDDRFGYIWNAWSDGTTEYRAENLLGLTWLAMVEAAGDRIGYYLHRAPEELYDLRARPALADQPRRGSRLPRGIGGRPASPARLAGRHRQSAARDLPGRLRPSRAPGQAVTGRKSRWYEEGRNRTTGSRWPTSGRSSRGYARRWRS